MKVISEKQLIGTSRDVKFKQGTSLRYLLNSDNMGFSLFKTIIPKGEIGNWHYKNHLEACYCIKGKGVLTNLSNGQSFKVNPFDCYVLDKNDNHTFEAIEDIILISVFNPPLSGREIHSKDNSYSESPFFDIMAEEIINLTSNIDCNFEKKRIIKEILTLKNK